VAVKARDCERRVKSRGYEGRWFLLSVFLLSSFRLALREAGRALTNRRESGRGGVNPDLRGGARRVGLQPTFRARGVVGWKPALHMMTGWMGRWVGTHPTLACFSTFACQLQKVDLIVLLGNLPWQVM